MSKMVAHFGVFGKIAYLVSEMANTKTKQLPRTKVPPSPKMASNLSGNGREASPKIGEERFRQLFEHMGSGVAIYEAVDNGEDFVIKDFNKAAEKIEHVLKRDILGRRVSEVFPGIKKLGLFKVFQKVWKTGEPEYLPDALYQDERNPGSWRENWVYKLSFGEIVAVYNDITYRKRAEQSLRKEMEWKNLLFWLYEKGSQLTDDELYGYILEQVVRLTGSTIGFFHRVSDDQKDLILTRWNNDVLKNCTVPHDTHYPIDQAGNWVDCVRLKRPVIYNDYSNSPNRKGLPQGHAPIRRFMSVPVMNGDKVDIIFGVGNKMEEYDDDDVAHIQLVAHDLQRTIRQHHSEEILQQSEAKYRSIFENANEGIFQTTPDGRYLSANPALARMYGYESPAEMIAAVYDIGQQYINPSDRTALKALFERNDLVKGFEAQLYRKDGSAIWISMNGRAIRDDAGRIIFYEGMAHDITDRKLAEDALRESEERYRVAIEASTDGVVIIKNGKHVFVNQKFLQMHGYEKQEEILGKSIAESTHLHPEDRPKIMEMEQKTRGIKFAPLRVDVRVVHKNGNVNHIDASVASITYQGEQAGLVFLRDVTERRQTEELLNRIVKSSPMGIYIIQNGKTQLVNAQFEQFTGYTEHEAIGMNLLDIVHPDDRAKVENQGRKMLKNKLASPYEFRIITKFGEIRTFMETVTPIQYQGGRAVLGNVMDITDRKILESQLSQAQKLESIGQLAAGIAHEINTPIQYVGDNIHFLQDAFSNVLKVVEDCNTLIAEAKTKSLTNDSIAQAEQRLEALDLPYLTDEVPQAIKQSLEGVERVTKIVRAMKEFSHPGTKEKTLIDINRAIENTITVSKNEWKYVSDMVTDFDPSLPLVPCLPGEFNQVILNIIVNAAQAMGEIHDGSDGKGSIKISTKHTGDAIEIRVSDTGPGIPKNIKSRIFDPFFTTKEVGKGTGQGLAIARSVIVDKHNGTISCETEIGKGTTFTINLPLEDKQQGE